MCIKNLIYASLLIFVLFSVGCLNYEGSVQRDIGEKTVVNNKSISETPIPTALIPEKSKVVAYYFHTTYRCSTCLTIENYSREAIKKYFAEELQNGILEFKSVNVEEIENQHYIKDYQLYTKSLVIVSYQGAQQKNWKTLNNVWIYVTDREKFYQYVKDEIIKSFQDVK